MEMTEILEDHTQKNDNELNQKWRDIIARIKWVSFKGKNIKPGTLKQLWEVRSQQEQYEKFQLVIKDGHDRKVDVERAVEIAKSFYSEYYRDDLEHESSPCIVSRCTVRGSFPNELNQNITHSSGYTWAGVYAHDTLNVE